MPAKPLSIALGFLILFAVYHFPEFFNSLTIAAIFKIGFLIIAYVIARWQGWRGLGGFGLGFTNNWFGLLIAGLIAGLIFYAASIAFSVYLGYEHVESIISISSFVNALPMILLMTFFPSIAEDILTRGYLFGHLKQLKPVAWIFISAAVYVLNHIWRLGDGLPVLSYLFLLGLVLGVCVMAKRSLWLALGVHWGANIAFELSMAGVKLKDGGDGHASTWCLAAAWGIALLILASMYAKELKKRSGEPSIS